MEKEPGDDYVRRFAAIVRAHEQRLANTSSRKGAGAPGGYLNPLTWVGWDSSASTLSSGRAPPTLLQLDLHHLYHLLIRFEGLGIAVGPLDIRLTSTSRPVSRGSTMAARDTSDAVSISSFTSALSTVSKLSLGASWFGRVEQPVDSEIKYTYSAFTVLPALSIRQNHIHVIAELANDPPVDNAVPMYSFKNLTTLELLDVDPCVILGWDQLSESLRSLTIKRGGIEDFTDLFIDCVLDDQAWRDGNEAGSAPAPSKRSKPSRFGSGRVRRGPSISVPASVKEDEQAESQIPVNEAPPSPKLPPRKWRMLRHLSLADNAITFFPTTPLSSLTSITHLDLSNNLLVCVPPGLSALYNLVSLNLADNMIDSVLGIYTNLGQVLTINLSNNRLESICGLERLAALERVDLRGNLVQDPGEIGRLALLPSITEIWILGNPVATMDEQYRVHVFELFAHENKSILLDGTPPSFLEARNMQVAAPVSSPDTDALAARRNSSAPSPPVVAVGSTSPQPRRSQDQWPVSVLVNGHTSRAQSPPLGSHALVGSPPSVMSSGSKQPKRKQRRLVDLDGSHRDGSHSDTSPVRDLSEIRSLSPQRRCSTRHRGGVSESDSPTAIAPSDLKPSDVFLSSAEIHGAVESQSAEPVISVRRKGKLKSRHGRYSTEGNPVASEDVAYRVNAAPTPNGPDRPSTVLETGDEGDADAEATSHADAYRAHIDALRREVGDSWLKVLSQSGGLSSGVHTRAS